jgi:hypothetical protein
VLFGDKKSIIEKFYRFCLVGETVEQPSGQDCFAAANHVRWDLARLISARPYANWFATSCEVCEGVGFVDIPIVSGQGFKPIEVG